MRLPNWVVVYWPFGRSSRNAMNSWLFWCFEILVASIVVEKPTPCCCCCCCCCQCTAHSRAIIATISRSLVAAKNLFSCLLRFCCFIFLLQHFAVAVCVCCCELSGVWQVGDHFVGAATPLVCGNKTPAHKLFARSLDVSADCVAAAAA